MTLKEALSQIQPTDQTAQMLAQRRWNSIAKPLQSLGLLEDTVTMLAGMKHGRNVKITKPCVVVMCADNGVVAEGVTQTSQEVTAVVTKNFTTGATSVCRMAQVAGAKVVPVDIGVARDVDAQGLLVKKIAYGTKNMALEPAMTREQAVAAIEVGINTVIQLAEQGFDLFATGEMGIGNTTTSSAVTAVLLHKSVSDVTGRGAGLSSEGVKRKIAVIRRAIATNNPDPDDVLDTVSKVGGFDIAGLIGVFLGGAVMQLPVLIDGFISSVAALCAIRLCPHAAGYMLPSHVSNEPAGKLLMHELNLQPFLTCNMCLGEGTGAVAAIPILNMACQVYNDMSTFSEIEIEDYQPLE
ncbi:nicotinate-nucleotide--dimethylbenzimidazole phosphoribosyltransferase [Hydrogenoanaerobacterium sp.]|uniref:nicotinate-nucleotide--dimethylbenzimidazole phosphoribosyltransferase n=1 Tax=Hydrogenoanaerobacterium sp. TaxID=2953763 RepID=UPI00289A3E8C|nr:nicotinate-nucleotide--dimethylbenzimidazole phosphoribosyltransferase [Hydrogenoanaerobacterium sp.]